MDNKKEKYFRPSWDEYFLDVMRMVGTRSTCDRGRSGCIVVRDKRILSTGYVGSPAGTRHCDDVGHEMHTVVNSNGKKSQHCIRTAHAEQNALTQAARTGISLEGSELFCDMTPCYVCAKMIINSGIKRVVCNKDYHAGDRSKEIFKEAGVEYVLVNNEMQTYDDM